MDFTPGLYKVISAVYIRREPRIVEYRDKKERIVTNIVGSKNIGDYIRIDATTTDSRNQTWGKVSEPDAAGKSLWICLRDINRTFAEKVEQEDHSTIPDPAACMQWMKAVDEWARSQSTPYTGPRPWP